ncbi:MAG: SDR family NAD(P)-dependent oxidoreductase [Magnetospiraceae bacterium]
MANCFLPLLVRCYTALALDSQAHARYMAAMVKHKHKSLLITGASSGIGAGLAREYAAPGVSLALSGRNAARLQAVAEDCRKQGAQVSEAIIDVTDREATSTWIKDVDGQRPLDLVIANAGVSQGTSEAEEGERSRRILEVNTLGVIYTVDAAARQMEPRGHGQIGIVASLAAFRGMPAAAKAYSASKAAAKAYGEGLRMDLAPKNIGVSVICPGFVTSRITDQNKFTMPLLMDPARSAAIIARGLERNKARIAFPWPLYFGAWLLGALPPALSDMILRQGPVKE